VAIAAMPSRGRENVWKNEQSHAKAAVIFPTALPLAIGSTANKLLWMIAARLEDLLAITATATHQAAPNRDANLPL